MAHSTTAQYEAGYAAGWLAASQLYANPLLQPANPTGNATVIVSSDGTGGAIARDISSQIVAQGPESGIVFSNAFTKGNNIFVRNGNYTFTRPAQIPNLSGLVIQGEGAVTIDARKVGGTVEMRRKTTQNGIFNHGREDSNFGIVTPISNITIRNFTILGSFTAEMYEANDIFMAGIRLDLVTNFIIQNITTRNVGISVSCQGNHGGIISNCKSYNDGAGPTLGSRNGQIIVDSCYTYASLDDSFAMLGGENTGGFVFSNNIADKAQAPRVTASCFKLDSGLGLSDVKYINCKALNAKPGRPEIQGGFINGDPSIRNITYTGCQAINCHQGFKMAGQNCVMHGCNASNCNYGIVIEGKSPGNQILHASLSGNKQDTWFLTQPAAFA